MKRIAQSSSKWPFALWLGYTVFVIYGSLVPLRFKARPLAEAWAAFQNIAYLQLAVDSRADWISNGVLYVPLSFLTAYWLTQTASRAPRPFLYGLAAIFSAGLALAVEFTQLFFPQRTVSLNDIIAEWIGSGIGLMLLAFGGDWFHQFLHSMLGNRRQLANRALLAYTCFYIAFSLFPYDILLSKAELLAKVHTGNWGWFLAKTDASVFRLGLQTVIEIVLTLPLGFLWAVQPRRHPASYPKAALWGCLLGLLVEVAQFFTATGISQGLSVLTRALSFCTALSLGRHPSAWSLVQARVVFKNFSLPLLAVYLPTLLAVNGWFSFNWQGASAAMVQLDTVQFLPFYYHYFTSEANALQSLASVSLSYLPLALLLWANHQSAKQASIYGGLLAMGIEASKLFHVGNHPDPTNILLAGVATWATVRTLAAFGAVLPSSWPLSSLHATAYPPPLSRPPSASATLPPTQANHQGANASATTAAKPSTLLFLLLPLVLGIVIWLAGFPAYAWLLGAVLFTCGVAVWRKPIAAFAIIPAALPVFDLAPWTGRFYFDEFDALVMLVLAVGFGRTPKPAAKPRRADPVFTLLLALVLASFAIGAARGLLPLQWPDTNAFNNYYSPYNALRIVKGAAWAGLMLVLSRRFGPGQVAVRHQFSVGMVVGLGLAVAVVFWERLAFSQFLDFSGDYRVTGPFSAMHTGGAYVECFIAVATTFLVGQLLTSRSWLVGLSTLSLLAAATYALMVTFSRGGYLAFAVGIGIVLLSALLRSNQRGRTLALGAGLVTTMLLIAIPIYKGGFAQSRMASVGADLGLRNAHWQDALSLRDASWSTALLGMGLGRFPEASFWNSTALPKPGTFVVKTEAGNRFLRLGGGDPVYAEQLVPVVAGQTYTLKLDMRADKPGLKVAIPLCQKWMLASNQCKLAAFNLSQDANQWHTYTAQLSLADFPKSPWYLPQPIKMSLFNATDKTLVDMDNLRLENPLGQNILVNGDFSQVMDRWFTATDSHLQWHIKSMPYAIVFDQGWLGLVAVGALIALALSRTTSQTILHTLSRTTAPASVQPKNHDAMAGVLLAALASFLATGVFDTLIDNPRFLMLFLFLCCLCGYKNHRLLA